MTSRAPRGGRIGFLANRLDATERIDAHVMRDAIANDALHSADQGGSPVWVNWVAVSPSNISGAPRTALRGTPSFDNVWFKMAIFGPFPLSVFSDNRPHAVRVALLGASSVGGTDVKFGVVISGGPGDVALLGTGIDSIEFAVTSSTTPAWLAPTVPATDVIVPSRSTVFDAIRTRESLSDVGGSGVSVPTYEIFVTVFGQTEKTLEPPDLHGLHVAQFVGPA